MSRAGCARERSWWKCKPNRKLPATPSASNALSSSLVSEFFAPSPGLHSQLILAMSSGTIHKARFSDFLQETHWADCVLFSAITQCVLMTRLKLASFVNSSRTSALDTVTSYLISHCHVRRCSCLQLYRGWFRLRGTSCSARNATASSSTRSSLVDGSKATRTGTRQLDSRCPLPRLDLILGLIPAPRCPPGTESIGYQQ